MTHYADVSSQGTHWINVPVGREVVGVRVIVDCRGLPSFPDPLPDEVVASYEIAQVPMLVRKIDEETA